MKQSFKVTWDQWFRYGPHGDESTFDTKTMCFDTLEEAESFAADLAAGRHRGACDMSVYDNEITICDLNGKEELYHGWKIGW
jgi:hypothetical protein